MDAQTEPAGFYGGLTLADALRLCARRHEELFPDDIKFVRRLGAAKKPMKPEQASRLAALVERLRGQLDWMAETGIPEHE